MRPYVTAISVPLLLITVPYVFVKEARHPVWTVVHDLHGDVDIALSLRFITSVSVIMDVPVDVNLLLTLR